MGALPLSGASSNAWRSELRGVVRALSGAFLFGIPLLYTMEMWWLGEISRPGQPLLVLGVTLLSTLALVAVDVVLFGSDPRQGRLGAGVVSFLEP